MEPKEFVYEVTRHYSNDFKDVVAESLLKKVNGFIRSRRFDLLSSCTSYFESTLHTIHDWRYLRQIEAFFKKNDLFAVEGECIEKARESFFANERQCFFTNLRLQQDVPDEELSQAIRDCQNYITMVLGDFSDFINSLHTLIKITSGATAHSPRSKSIPQLKIKSSVFCANRAEPYVRAVCSKLGLPLKTVKKCISNRVELVPKNWRTHRTIACEPEGNLPLQLAFDTFAKQKLKEFGIRLSDQSANQRRAKHASIHNDLVTVDMKAASDTISYNTVHRLFPVIWFEFLESVRTRCFRGVFGRGVYHKFSSMGNGSTFAIETLIFASVCYAAGDKDAIVYGDDVIIHKSYYPKFLRIAEYLGFTINQDKTFADGPFRESCGKDYWLGTDVTPVFIRSVDSRKATLCHLINTLGTLTFPGSKLGDLLSKVVSDSKLPLVPYNESSLSGVWIDPVRAHQLGILRFNQSVKKVKCFDLSTKRRVIRAGPRLSFFKAYTAKSKPRKFSGIRGYLLWFFHKNRQVSMAKPWEGGRLYKPDSSETSTVPVFMHKYVRKWVNWQPPVEGMPTHLQWFLTTYEG